MASVCTSSLRLSLPNVLRNALRSEFASDVHQSPAHRRLSVTPLSHRACRTSRRNFGSSPNTQLYPSPIYLSSQESSSTSADISNTPPSDNLGKAPRGESSTEDALPEANAASDPADIKTEQGGSQPDTRAHKKSQTKPSRSKKSPRDEQPSTPAPAPKKKLEKWEVQKKALQGKFKEGWNPPKKLSPDALEGIRHLHAVAPERFTTPVLAEEFKVSPEAIRRILKSKWRPSETELDDRRKRWEKRHDRIWGHLSELGLRPSTKRTRDLVDANQVLYGNKKGPKE
ncbi:required for respiratory growth protein 9, mitochondrial [Aspergillus sclerotiicarbonarius CBS 121057]|uniref:Required for respiratory growth protein 9, mitochondrial n=1 Tax=Aspergillus sclerotiicarbonarius (strain CBS 121057 / IBT 28362) TaxID=1448318 RepID=A0A319F0L4_ASPSB|nr:required for respiratory growth protein 9, mitochondrial [Aspergillus sclerotiicarbonarius CBS 121057]